MRKAMRLALPVVAAASALVLTGCGDDEAPFGVEGGGFPGGGGSQEQLDGLEGMEDLELEELPGDSGGATGGDDAPAPGDDTGGSTGGTTGGGGGTATVDQIQGTWYNGDPGASETSTLQVAGNTVAWEEENGGEGDICSGTATDGAITFDSCSQYGSSAWSSMAATLTTDGSTLTMTFDDGSVFQYALG
jgi:hypothetical protein